MFPGTAIPDYGISGIGLRPLDSAWNPDEARTSGKWNELDSIASYIGDQRTLNGMETTSGSEAAPIDITLLKGEQKVIVDNYIEVYQHVLRNEPVGQMKYNIDGTAGCGKSFVIRAICQGLRRMANDHDKPDPIRVLTPSACAALNSGGITIHSGLGIPISDGPCPLLTGSRLATLQQQWKGAHFVIIDEKSMLGQRLFAKIHARLQQMKPSDEPFGGFHIALIGDFSQLPPVKDRALYAKPAIETTDRGQLSQDGHALYLYTLHFLRVFDFNMFIVTKATLLSKLNFVLCCIGLLMVVSLWTTGNSLLHAHNTTCPETSNSSLLMLSACLELPRSFALQTSKNF